MITKYIDSVLLKMLYHIRIGSKFILAVGTREVFLCIAVLLRIFDFISTTYFNMLEFFYFINKIHLPETTDKIVSFLLTGFWPGFEHNFHHGYLRFFQIAFFATFMTLFTLYSIYIVLYFLTSFKSDQNGLRPLDKILLSHIWIFLMNKKSIYCDFDHALETFWIAREHLDQHFNSFVPICIV